MRHLLLALLLLGSSVFSLKAYEDKWKDNHRSIPPVSSVVMNGYALCIHFDLPVDAMLLQVWDAEGGEVYTQYIVRPPVGDYYVALDNLQPGEYTFRLSQGTGYWEGGFTK